MSKRIQQIKHWSGHVLFECEIPDEIDSGMKMRHALEKATRSDADLRGADLRDADLRDADLRGANLRGADLRGANLRGAYLSDAYLRGANLSDAYLRGANLRDADLRGANLRGADLRGANLSDADLSDADLSGAYLSDADLSDAYLRGANLSDAYLRGANLSDAYLRGANLSGAYLSGAKNDFWEILMRSTPEIAGLRDALVSGRVDGSTYEGSCACLVGTIANVRGVNYEQLGENGVKPNSSRPAERWFMGIKEGDTPETNQISAITVEWLDEFVGLLNAAKAVQV